MYCTTASQQPYIACPMTRHSSFTVAIHSLSNDQTQLCIKSSNCTLGGVIQHFLRFFNLDTLLPIKYIYIYYIYIFFIYLYFHKYIPITSKNKRRKKLKTFPLAQAIKKQHNKVKFWNWDPIISLKNHSTLQCTCLTQKSIS